MAEVFTGGCQCGAVRFRVEGPVKHASICNCRMCQKALGNFIAPFVSFSAPVVWTRGRPAEFQSSQVVHRGFCSNCGTPLYYRWHGGRHISLAIGAFDEPHRIPLLYQMGLEGKHPSLFHLDDVEEVGTTEAAQGDEAAAIKRTNNQHPDHDTSEWTPRPSNP